MNNSIEAPQQSTGSTFLQWAVGITLIVVGFRIGYYTDKDWDGDGLPNDAEMKCNMKPRNADSDGDGVKDGKETFRLYFGTPTPLSDTLLADEVCLTSPDGKKNVCYHPAEILEIEITVDGRYILYDWQGDAQYIRENLESVDGMMRNIGYFHFFKVNRQTLANMLLAECLSGDRLYLSREEDLWCHISREKVPIIAEQVQPCDTIQK